jgi:hypothetical protein
MGLSPKIEQAPDRGQHMRDRYSKCSQLSGGRKPADEVYFRAYFSLTFKN